MMCANFIHKTSTALGKKEREEKEKDSGSHSELEAKNLMES